MITREETYNRIDAIIAKYEIDDEYVTITNSKDYDALRMVRELLEQEPCDDAISRQAVLDLPKNTERGFGGKIIEQSINIEYIKALPSVKPEQKVGHWISIGDFECRCSECQLWCYKRNRSRYCPSCGAKMVVPQESEDKK